MKLEVTITVGQEYGVTHVRAEGAEELVGVTFEDEDDGQAIGQALDSLVARVKERARWQIGRRREIAALALKAKRAEEAAS